MPQPLIVSGPPRCGTTILGMVLQSHPSIALTLESDLPRIAGSIDAAFGKVREHSSYMTLTEPPPANPVPAPAVNIAHSPAPENRFAALERRRHDGFLGRVHLPSGPNSVDERMRGLLHAFFAISCGKQGFAWYGDKMPLAHRKTDLAALEQLGIDPAWIFIFRDPRAMVASSNRRWADTLAGRDMWDIASTREAIAAWVDAWDFARAAMARGKRVLLLKYRDLLAAPRTELARISNFLGISENWPEFELFDTPRDITSQFLPEQEEEIVRLLLGDLCDAWDQPITELMSRGIVYTALAGERLDFTRLDPLQERILGAGVLPADDWCRWTGPIGHLQFRLPRTRRPREARLTCGAYSGSAARADLRIALNGGPALDVPAQMFDAAQGGGTLSIALPPGAERIELAIANTCPKGPGDAPVDDPRALGVALMALEFVD